MTLRVVLFTSIGLRLSYFSEMSSLLAHKDESDEHADKRLNIGGDLMLEEHAVDDDNKDEHEEDIADGNGSVHRFVVD